MPEPADARLYASVKRQIYAKIPTHSAYRSGLVVQEYKRRGGKYLGKRTPQRGLERWFAEEWRNQRGQVGYTQKGDVYRPTRRINPETPLTFGELTAAEVEDARREKSSKGRVKSFGEASQKRQRKVQKKS